ncbi:iron ABC transporter permease [Nocardioides sp.]|uniref:ABC transporter permease n=1 Tax=Nocardioides sp. TaxID=35761 RepID=UPI002613F9EC|nr:iron ABC transporter permease [Nocardioides sp.]MCW2737085.1 iron transporter permease [Nocardioides sp.]
MATTSTGRRTPLPLLAAGALVALLALVPLGYVAFYVVVIGPVELWQLVARPRIVELLRNTVTLAAACMAATAVLGVALAVLVERTDLPGRRLWHGLMVAPLAVPAFVNGYAWVSLDSSIQGFAGAFGVVTLSYYPLVYLPVVAMLRRLDPALEESAWSLGHSRARTFRTVVLPQLRPALLGGALLVGLHLLAEFGALSLLRFPTFTTAIYDQYGSTFNGNAATAMAGVLVLLCLVLLLAELRLRGDRRYARVGGGAARGAVLLPLGAWRWPLLAVAGAVVALAVGVPAYSLGRWLVVGTSTEFPLDELGAALAATIVLALAGAVVTTLAAVPVVWLAVRHRGLASTVIERSTYVANALPGIVVGLALVVASLRLVPVVYQTAGLLVAAYAILFLPRAVVTARAGLEQAPVVLDDVAHSLGVGPLATARRVTLPLIAPSLGAGAALVFLAISTELTATLMLSPIGTRTLATEFWSASSELRYGAAAPYALLLVLVSIPATVLLMRMDTPTPERLPA